MDIRKQVKQIQDSAISDPRFKQNEEIQITPEAVNYVDKVFRSILPHFPAWRQTCPTDSDLGMMKAAWTKAIVRHSMKTGSLPNAKAGVTACEESDSDWLPSVGKFIKMCEQSNDLMPLAQRALDLFNSAQKQIDNVGKMVTGKHGFDLKNMKAAETGKRFIELYLSYAEDNPIESLEAFALPQSVQLSDEQLKEAEKRKQAAQNQFFKQFGSIKADKPVEQPKKEVKGVQKGSLKTYSKTPKQLDEERKRQLDAIKHRGAK